MEQHALVGYFAQTIEAKHLEASRVRQNGARPCHESMQAAKALNALVSGPKKQMVGVSQDDFGVQTVFEIALHQAFHSGLRADRHEYGSFNHAVRGVQQARTRASDRTLGLNLESKSRHLALL
jgi:hypothetical protein